jgi:hypothetical protein
MLTLSGEAIRVDYIVIESANLKEHFHEFKRGVFFTCLQAFTLRVNHCSSLIL